MGRLVSVCRSDDFKFENRQLPLYVDDAITMVVQFNESCLWCGCQKESKLKPRDPEIFQQRFSLLSKEEIAEGLRVSSKEVFSLLAQMIPCVGCRRSIERLFNQLVESGNPALEPLIVTKNSVLTINKSHLFDSQAIYALLYIRVPLLNEVIDIIPKSRKNRRCVLHSLDNHKTRSLGSWTEVWDVLSKECREEVVLIDADTLLDTLENYLRKHRFCADCKSKVMRAYNILIGEIDSSKEKGYCPVLYDGLKCCPQVKHIHVHCDTDFIAHMIGRAEPELIGSPTSSRRERHAKTLDIAQEEVLTCLGIHLYERLHKIWQKLRAEEQTWQILFCLGVEALKKKFEMALEKKQGVSNLELMCEELLQEERLKEQKREQKRQKRRKKRSKNNNSQCPDETENDVSNAESCKCAENVDSCSNHRCTTCDPELFDKTLSCTSCKNNDQKLPNHPWCKGEPVNLNCSSDISSSKSSNRSDAGYSSGHEGCESCSLPSSNDGSDIVCPSDHFQHDGESSPCSSVELSDTCKDCSLNSSSRPRKTRRCNGVRKKDASHELSCTPGATFKMKLSLQDMLEVSCSSDDDFGDTMISEEEIQSYKANQTMLDSKRQELREILRKRFDMLCLKSCKCDQRECCEVCDVSKFKCSANV